MTAGNELEIKLWDGHPDVIIRYAQLLTRVYDRPISASYMHWKHCKNPVALSHIAYAQNQQGEMVAARAFWPMYSDTAPIYQPCDTVTHPGYQRRGLFSALTKLCLEKLESNAAVVNFPNNNSYPAYLKLGWQCFAENKKVLGVGFNFHRRRITDLAAYLDGKMEPERAEYLAWRFSQESSCHYKCYTHPKGMVVSHGGSDGLITFAPDCRPFGKSSGMSKGYVLPGYFSSLKAMLTGSLALSCSSRTAYYLLPAASTKTLTKAFKQAQVNTLMDTF